jgi:hypothetical protein
MSVNEMIIACLPLLILSIEGLRGRRASPTFVNIKKSK